MFTKGTTKDSSILSLMEELVFPILLILFLNTQSVLNLLKSIVLSVLNFLSTLIWGFLTEQKLFVQNIIQE